MPATRHLEEKAMPKTPVNPRNHRGKPRPRRRDRLRSVKEAFTQAGYTDAGILERLGVNEVREATLAQRPVMLYRTRELSPLDVLLRLFILETPCGLEAFRRAVRPGSVDAWVEAGFVVVEGAEVRAAVRVLPYRGLLVAFDLNARLETPKARDYVMGIGSSSLTLANLTVRKPSRATLDVGTGCGFQALLAAAHSDRVVAVDRNPRAVQFARLNAALNGLDHVECLEGDCLEPVIGQRFDLIVANPPFVISPETRFMYRDSGLEADGICRKIIEEAARHLNDGGFCQVLCHWVERSGEDWKGRLAQWVAGSGCDAWVIRSETRDAATYASTWIDHTERERPESAGERFVEWLAHYRRLGIEAVGGGIVNLRRASGRANWFRAEEGPERMVGPCGEAVLRGFEARDFVQAAGDDEALLAARLRYSAEVRLEQTHVPSVPGWMQESVRLVMPLGFVASGDTDPYMANLVIGCDGRRPLGGLLRKMAADLEVEPAAIRSSFCDIVRRLVLQGFLLPVSSPQPAGLTPSV